MNILPGVEGSGTEYWAAMSAQTTQNLQHTCAHVSQPAWHKEFPRAPFSLLILHNLLVVKLIWTFTRTEWRGPWRRRSWSRRRRWCTRPWCCPAGTGPPGPSSAERTTSRRTAVKSKHRWGAALWPTCFYCCGAFPALTLLGSKSSLTLKLSTTQEADRLRSTQAKRSSSRAILECSILEPRHQHQSQETEQPRPE